MELPKFPSELHLAIGAVKRASDCVMRARPRIAPVYKEDKSPVTGA